MLSDTLDVLSLWEVAHRWHGYDPDRTDPSALPLDVQDTLRFLARAMWLHELPSYSAAGVERKTDGTLPPFERWAAAQSHRVGPTGSAPRLDPAFGHVRELDAAELAYLPNLDELRERYSSFSEAWSRQHNAAVEPLQATFQERHYDRTHLEAVYVHRDALATLCQDQGLELPSFWFTDAEQKSARKDNAPPRPERIAKERCQAIALTLWDIDEDLPIAHLAQHDAIQRHGNGRYYGERTVHNWLSEVDPRSKEEKTGRPRKKQR